MYNLICNFSINEGRRININELVLSFHMSNNVSCSLMSREKEKTISNSKRLKIVCKVFKCKEDAFNYSEIVYSRLFYFGLKYDTKIIRDIKKPTINKDFFKKSGPIVEYDSIIVYEEKLSPLIISISFDSYKSYDNDKIFFINSLINNNIGCIRNPHIKNFLYYFNDVIDEKNQQLKLLKAMIALESLLVLLNKEDTKKDKETIKLLDLAIKTIKENSIDGSPNLINIISNLKTKSVKHKMIILLNILNINSPIMGMEIEKFIIMAYSVRSDISHGNDLSKNNYIKKYSFELTIINRELENIGRQIITYLVDNNLINEELYKIKKTI